MSKSNESEEPLDESKPVEPVMVKLKWNLCKPDPLSYKPYAPELEPMDTYIIVEIPNEPKYVHALNDSANNFTNDVYLTPRGMALAMKKVAIAIAAVGTPE